ncbi:MAG: N-acetylmuramoyl-L-alanine amidase [Myxococcota bacterium]
MFLLLPPVLAAPHAPAPATVSPNALEAAFDAAADEFDVPEPILKALAWEASRFDPDAISAWGGWGMFDLREGDLDPSLEHAAALLELDPNVVGTDWRPSGRGAAAILADQARLSNGGTLPGAKDLPAWWDAVRAFSGREEPFHQDLYARYIFQTAYEGAATDTRWGLVAIEPVDFDFSGMVEDLAQPPPSSADSSEADAWTAASSANYSNYSRGAGDIDYVIIHTVQGSYSGCISWFQNSSASVSAHYVVRSSDGHTTQMVHEEDVAWHAGNWDYNLASIGIEHEGWVDEPDTWYTDAMYAESAALVAEFSARQTISLDRSHIIAHSEVPGATHTDPGSGWDWDYYMSLVTGSGGVVDGQIIGVVADGDIYNGARLVGASVWIEGTSYTDTVDAEGYYTFDDLPYGTYRVWASYPGYVDGSCDATLEASQKWCSIALTPDSGGGDDTGGDTDVPVDTGGAGDDTGPGDVEDTDDGSRAPLPGNRVRMDEVAGCACDAGATGGAWLALAPLFFAVRRRRQPPTVLDPKPEARSPKP